MTFLELLDKLRKDNPEIPEVIYDPDHLLEIEVENVVAVTQVTKDTKEDK